jgi:hypothetical protein
VGVRLTGTDLDAKLDVRLPRPLLERVRALALDADRSLGAEVRVAIRRHIEREAEQAEREDGPE